MVILNEITGELINELKRISKYEFWGDIEGDANIIPATIMASNGKVIRSTSQLDSIIYDIAIHLRDHELKYNEIYSNRDIFSYVREVIGPLIANLDLDHDVEHNANVLLRGLRHIISSNIVLNRIRDYTFGCDLFNCRIDTISIGPLVIEYRDNWLSNKLSSKSISLVAFRRIHSIWEGKVPRKRKPSWDNQNEIDIVNLIGNQKYVCSVSADDLAEGVGLQKSLLATKIAFAAIAMHWKVPSSTLRDFNIGFEGKLFNRAYLVFNESGIVTASSQKSYKPGGSYIKKDEWVSLYEKEKPFFDFYGEVLSWVLGKEREGNQAALINVFAQATFWFHEACREKLDMVAIVKFAAALDILAGGQGDRHIVQILKYRAKLNETDVPFRDKSTVKQAVKLIYKSGRSRFVHGTTEEFRCDWSIARSKAEFLARACILSCVDWVIEKGNSANLAMMRSQ